MNPIYPMNLTNFEAMAKAHQEQIDRRISNIRESQRTRNAWVKILDHIKENPGTSDMRIFQMIQQSMGEEFLKEFICHHAPILIAQIDDSIESEINDLRMMIVRK